MGVHVLNEFVVTERGVDYIKNDADIVSRSLVKQIGKMLEYLQVMKVGIGHEVAASIICVLSNIESDKAFAENMCKGIEILVIVLVKEAKRYNRQKVNDYLSLQHVLPVVAGVLAHTCDGHEWDG